MQDRVLFAGAVTLVFICGASAQTIGSEDSGEIVKLDRILVTDGLTPVVQEKSGRAFTVITGQDLEKSQVRHLADALRMVPGFSVTRLGSQGAQTQVRVRGAESNHVLVLIDGVEASETSTGEFDFGSLIVDEIDRIEVLRGPQSAFLGSDALAGVINVITKRGERGGWSTRMRSETGTDGTFLGGVALSGGGENYDVALSGLFRRNDGFNISSLGSEKDGDRNATLNGKFTYDVTPDFVVDGTLRYVDRKSELDGQDFSAIVQDTGDWTKTREFYSSLGATHVSFDGALTQRARFNYTNTHRENYAELFFPPDTEADGDRLKANYQATYAFDTPDFLAARHQFTGGYEWERESYTASHLDQRFHRDIHSFVAEYRGEFADQFYLNLGIRHDRNDRFADTTTYSIAGAWRIGNSDTRLHASAGTGVTNPTFVEQFGWDPNQFIGNPDLVPEKSFGWDIGVEQTFFDGMLIADLTYFNQNLTDEIQTIFSMPATVANLDGVSKRHGVELAARIDLFNGFTAHATYSYLLSTQQEFSGGPRTDEVRRPRHSGSLGLAYTFLEDRARIFADAVFNGDTLDDDFSVPWPEPPARITLPAYTLVNIGGSYQINDNLEAYGRIENLLDEDYMEVLGYNSPGRSAFVGLKAKF